MSGEHPWIMGPLRLESALLEQVQEHALECFPKECCGFLLGPAEEPDLLDEMIREENEADRFHALDPETFPRTAETYFKINELRASRLFSKGESSGRPVKVIYHSHCGAGAYFSEEDAATFAHEGQLMWPCAFLVVSVIDGRVADRRLWSYEPASRHFVQATLELL